MKFKITVIVLLLSILTLGTFNTYQALSLDTTENIYFRFFEDLPHPAAIKNTKHELVAMNKEFYNMLEVLGIEEDLVGKIGEPFGEEALAVFISHDKMVMSKGGPILFEEHIPNYGKSDTYKFPLKNYLDNTVGLSLICIMEEKNEDE